MLQFVCARSRIKMLFLARTILSQFWQVIWAIMMLMGLASCGGGGHEEKEPGGSSLLQAARSISFADTDYDSAEFGGTLTLGRAEDERAVASYRIYWSDATQQKLQRLASVPKASTTEVLTWTLPANTRAPSDSTHFFVVTADAQGSEMSEGVSTRHIDIGEDLALPYPVGAKLKDMDPDAGQLGGTLDILAPIDEGGIAGYHLFWADEYGVALRPLIAVNEADFPVSALRSRSIIVPQDTPIPPSAAAIVIAAHNAGFINTLGFTLPVLDFTSNAQGRGPGGNTRTGIYHYGEGDYPTFAIQKHTVNGDDECILDNGRVMVVDMAHQFDHRHSELPDAPQTVDDESYPAYRYPCEDHNENRYKEFNGAFSPLNDTFYYGNVVSDMFLAYLGEPPLRQKLRLRTHFGNNYANANWDGAYANFGDGDRVGNISVPPMFPLTMLEVISHEIAHGFTRRYSDLYGAQSSGVNEAFSDMAGEAAEYYLYGEADWWVTSSVVSDSRALRYFAHPAEDGSSSESLDDYIADARNAHKSSGIFRKAFYLLVDPEGTQPQQLSWTIPLAFKTFALANKYCWQRDETFESAAQCVLAQAPRMLHEFAPACFREEHSSDCRTVLASIENDLRKAFAQVDIYLPINQSHAAFSFNTGVRSVNVMDTSFAENAELVAWQWSFGDGAVSNTRNATHDYAEGGRYWVSLTVTDSNNLADTYTREVSIADDYCAAGSRNSENGWITNVSIGNFSRYSAATESSAPFSGSIGLASGARLPLALRAGIAQGTVNENLYWKIWVDYNQDGEFQTSEVAFEGSGDGSGPLEGEILVPDDLPVGSSQVRVAMRVGAAPVSACGNVDKGEVEDFPAVFQLASVSLEPAFSFSLTPGSATSGVQVKFSNESLVPTGSEFTWDMGDGTIILPEEGLVHPSHTYMVEGRYTVHLSARDPQGEVKQFSTDLSIQFQQDYCSAGNDSATQWERIAAVEFNSVENITSDEASGYQDFSSEISFNAGRGELAHYTLSPWFAEPEPYPEHWRVWIDYNQDRVFGDEEQVVAAVSDSPLQGSLAVPTDVPSGTTRLRVMISYGDVDDPCYKFNSQALTDGGQVEDYSINIE